MLTVIQQMRQANTQRGDVVQQFYLSLQMLLMARGRREFSAIQQEPSFSETGQRSFARLYDAYASGARAGFDEEWKQIQRLTIPPTQNERATVTYSGGPGLAKENAVVIHGASPEATVYGEYWYLAFTFGRMGVEWKPLLQALTKRDEAGKMYDLFEIEFDDGRRSQCYFDISHLPS